MREGRIRGSRKGALGKRTMIDLSETLATELSNHRSEHSIRYQAFVEQGVGVIHFEGDGLPSITDDCNQSATL